MPSITCRMSVRIAAPVEAVWSYLVDWEHLDRWMREASDFRVVSAQREGVGMVAQATISLAGFRTRDPIVVTAFESPTHLGIRHDGWVKGNGEMRCVPDGSGMLLHWTERYVPPLGALGWLGMRVLQPLLMRTFNRDLALLKHLVESERGRVGQP